jgi:hypothetical protein
VGQHVSAVWSGDSNSHPGTMVDLGDTTFNVTFDTVACARSDIVVEWNGGTHSTMPSSYPGSWNGGPSTVGVLAHRNLAVVHAEPLQGCTELTNGDAAGKIVVVERSPRIFSCAVGQQIKGWYEGWGIDECQHWVGNPNNGEWITDPNRDWWANDDTCDEAATDAVAKRKSQKCRPGTDLSDCGQLQSAGWYGATIASIDAGSRTITVDWDDSATPLDGSATNGRVLSFDSIYDSLWSWSSCLIRALDHITPHYSMNRL